MHDRFFNPDRFIAPSLLASIEGDPPGGAGGDEKKPLTAEEVQALVDKSVGKTVNAAVKDHLGRALSGDAFKATLAETVKGAIGDSVKEALEAAKAEGGAGGGEGDPPAGKGKGGKGDDAVPPAVQRQLDQMAKQLKQRDDELAKEKAARETEKKTREVTEEKTLLTEALTKGGAAPKRVKAAVALLYGEEKKVARNKEGQIFWQGDDDEELSLEDGVKAWLESETGQEFIPARQAQGSGNKPPAGGGGGGGKGKEAPDLASVMGSILGG